MDTQIAITGQDKTSFILSLSVQQSALVSSVDFCYEKISATSFRIMVAWCDIVKIRTQRARLWFTPEGSE
jgi:hypothetical protein